MRIDRLVLVAMGALTAVSSWPAISRAAPDTQPAPERAATAATVAATAAGATTSIATTRYAVVDGTVIQPAARSQWSDLFNIAVRGNKLEVESHPPPDIASLMTNGRQIDVEITNATERYWRLQGIAAQPRGVVVQPGGAIVVAGNVRFRIAGAGGAAGAAGGAAPARARPRNGAGGDAAAVEFSATSLVRPQPSDGPRVSRLMLMYGSFQLRGRWMHDGRTCQIDFRSFTDKSNVSLNVREYVRGRGAAVLTMEAADLQQIRRERPAEVRMYLEPLLIELCGGRNPLRPQPGDVYRAFQSIPADSDATERVNHIVDVFDALEPAVREAASAQLNQLGRPEVLAAARIDRTELSAEQSVRLDAFIARNSSVTDIAAARRDPMFLIDCVEDEDRAVRVAALDALREVVDQEIDFDIDAPPEQRAADATALEIQFLAKPTTTTRKSE